MYQALFSEYLGCPQHRTIILGLGTLLQCITIKCPSAVIWINSSDAKDKHIASPGSPLDILPFPPSSLPISGGPTLQNHQVTFTPMYLLNIDTCYPMYELSVLKELNVCCPEICYVLYNEAICR